MSEPPRERYEVRRARGVEPSMEPDPRHLPPGWEDAAEGRVERCAAAHSLFFPDMRFRVLWDEACLYVRMVLHDRWVRSVVTAPQGPVCTDSCCEFFVRPAGSAGYFNFETNAGGCLLLAHVTDPRRLPGGGLAAAEPVGADWLELHHASGEELVPLLSRAAAGLLIGKRDETYSYFEYGYSIKLFEYLGYGLPVVYVHNTPMDRFVTENGMGIGVECDPESFARGVRALFEEPEKYAQYRANACRALVSGNTWNHRVRQLVRELSALDRRK